MPGRSITSEKYRFGYNTQEKDNEISGLGNHNTAKFWEYDTRLGRRWNLDPKPMDGVSGYSVFNNNPIVNSDEFGDTLSNKNYSDALGLASKIIASRNKNKESNDYFNNAKIKAAVIQYAKDNNLSKADLGTFYQTTNQYHYLLGNMDENSFDQVNRSVINNSNLSDYQRVRITMGRAIECYNKLWGILEHGSNAALMVTEMSFGPYQVAAYVPRANVYRVINNPKLLEGLTLRQGQELIGTPAMWRTGTMARSTRADGWTIRLMNGRGQPADLYIQYHPGTPRHFNGAPYWKVSSGKSGIQKFLAN